MASHLCGYIWRLTLPIILLRYNSAHSKFKKLIMRNLHTIIAIFCLIVLAPQAFAAKPAQSVKANKYTQAAKAAQPTKEKVVLMPLRVEEEDAKLQGAMETAVAQGLQQKYVVFSGEQVAQKARAIFMKESRTAKHDCDETRCLEDIAIAFQAELIAIGNITKQKDGYFLALSIRNIFDNKVVYSNSIPCQNCNAYQVVEKLKELSGTAANPADIERQLREAETAQKASEGKLKAEQIRLDALTAEQRSREQEGAEYQRLQAAKAADDKRLAELKAQAEARRKSIPTQQAGNFPTLQSAVTEIKRLNERINAIEAGYEKELAQTRKFVSQRYAAQLDALSKAQKDEFEATTEFKTKQDKQRRELNSQRDAELGRMTATALAAEETAPLRSRIRMLAEREYVVGAESITAELGSYNADAQQFSISLRSKIPHIKLAMSGSIPLPIADAKTFKQQWVAGLVRAEATVKPGSETMELALVNDADNSRLSNEGGLFMTAQAKQEREREEKTYRPEMVKIPAVQPFLMAQTEVTQAQWRAVMGSNPSSFQGCDTCPVEQVSWNDVQDYLNLLNAKTGGGYRLPSEAEWEFACYGGNKTEYCGGDNLDSVAWYGGSGNSGDKTHPVAQKQANGYGLYDMSGNVWEWMSDCYNGRCGRRVLRGGSCFNLAHHASAAYRNDHDPADRSRDYGFRLARTLP